jgi:hypothetical protein
MTPFLQESLPSVFLQNSTPAEDWESYYIQYLFLFKEKKMRGDVWIGPTEHSGFINKIRR